MKLIMMRGLPASGKSTVACKMSQDSGAVRVNRDLLREMMHFSEWSPSNESTIIEMEKQIAAYILTQEGKDVIVDDTNITQKHEDMWNSFVFELQRKGMTDLTFSVVDINTDPFVCVIRDCERDKKVGTSVIIPMAMSSGRMPENRKYIICDLDGTLCDLTHRRNYVKETPKNWRKFYEELPNDTLIWPTVEKIVKLSEQYGEVKDDISLILVSARPENYREQTEKWLKDNSMNFYDALIMRRSGDYREDSIVKREILRKYFPDKNKIIKVFDDRPRVIRMWREEGLDVEDCGDGEEF